MALPDALDQYFVDHPDEFVGRPCEKLIVDPANESVARAHLVCAAAEMPLDRKGDEALLVAHAPLVGDLLRSEELRESGDRLLATERQPHRKVSLRGSGSEIAIVDGARKAIIGTIDGNRVQRECHPGAIYLHAGELYTVSEYDPAGGKVIVSRAEVDYFTTPMTEKETEILEVLRVRRDGALQAWLGRLLVTERVVGFERKKIRGRNRTIGTRSKCRLKHSRRWGCGGRARARGTGSQRTPLHGALHASEHAAISLFPLVALCDRGDIGGISIPLHPQVGCGAVFIYDGTRAVSGLRSVDSRSFPNSSPEFGHFSRAARARSVVPPVFSRLSAAMGIALSTRLAPESFSKCCSMSPRWPCHRLKFSLEQRARSAGTDDRKLCESEFGPRDRDTRSCF